MRTIRDSLVAMVLVVMVAGCGANTGDATTEGSESMAAAGSSTGRAAPVALSDAQIAHVAVTANTIDVDMARLVDSRTDHEGVLGFAATMIADHTAVNERAAALAERLGVTPEENAVSGSLQADASATRERLVGLRGDAFDRAYMEREVTYHQAVLEALDQTLIPGATNPELRGLLQEVRPAIAAHLEHARSLRDSLESEQ